MYINGHFCYAYKFGIVTNGLGIVRDISFYNKSFLHAYPDIVIGKKSDSPDEDKSLADSKALIPVLKDFFEKHPLINPKVFLGDAAFDSIEIYKYLLRETPFEKAYIPLKTKLKIEGIDYQVNEEGIPCCPHDSSLPMRREGSKTHLRCGLPSMKFVCPKADLLLAGITQLVTVLVADKLHKHECYFLFQIQLRQRFRKSSIKWRFLFLHLIHILRHVLLRYSCPFLLTTFRKCS